MHSWLSGWHPCKGGCRRGRGRWTILGYCVSEIKRARDSTYSGGKKWRTILGYWNKVVLYPAVSLFSGALSDVFHWRCLPSETSLPSIALIWKITSIFAKPGERISWLSVGSDRALLYFWSTYIRLVVDIQRSVFPQCRLSVALRTSKWIFLAY